MLYWFQPLMIAGNSPPLFLLSINADRLALMVCLLEGFRVQGLSVHVDRPAYTWCFWRGTGSPCTFLESEVIANRTGDLNAWMTGLIKTSSGAPTWRLYLCHVMRMTISVSQEAIWRLLIIAHFKGEWQCEQFYWVRLHILWVMCLIVPRYNPFSASHMKIASTSFQMRSMLGAFLRTQILWVLPRYWSPANVTEAEFISSMDFPKTWVLLAFRWGFCILGMCKLLLQHANWLGFVGHLHTHRDCSLHYLQMRVL